MLEILNDKSPDEESSNEGIESADQLCASVSPVDKYNAEKPGTEYDTEIGDDCKYYLTIVPNICKEKIN